VANFSEADASSKDDSSSYSSLVRSLSSDQYLVAGATAADERVSREDDDDESFQPFVARLVECMMMPDMIGVAVGLCAGW
jgi:hypothetical protein